MITFEVPNLDDLDLEDLDGMSQVFSSLGEYVRLKRVASEYRLAGAIETALSVESRCETIYNRLPDWAKW